MRGVLIAPGPAFWPEKSSVETLTYALDMAAWVDASGDELATVSVTTAWSISGDIQPIQVSVSGTLINVQVTGGIPGRTYAVTIIATTFLGSTFEETALLRISAPFIEAGDPIPTIPATIAATVTWAYGPMHDFSDPANSMYL